MPPIDIGSMTEELLIQTSDPATSAGALVFGAPYGTIPISTLTRSGGLATAVLSEAHEFVTGDYATVAGADLDGYNGLVQVSVLDAQRFTYAVDSGLASPATGTPTSTYFGDAAGGRKEVWVDVATIWAALMGLGTSAQEWIMAGALQAQTNRRFRTYARNDITPKMRVIWTPSAFYGDAPRTLEIRSVTPIDDGREWMAIDTGEIAA